MSYGQDVVINPDVDVDYIKSFVAAYLTPTVTSLDSETHIFHFNTDPEDWAMSDPGLIYVNRNGNYFRLMQDAESPKWLFVRGWGDDKLDGYLGWQPLPSMNGVDAARIIQMASVGGRTGGEELTFLPKAVTNSNKRCMVWRGNILRLHADMQAGTFKLGTEQGDLSPSFSGKPWASVPARLWCRENLADTMAHIAVKTTMPNQAAQRAQEAEAARRSLENNPLFGMF